MILDLDDDGDDDQYDLFTRGEVARRAVCYIRANLLVDAGYTRYIVANAPAGISRAKLFVMRWAFFRGAQCLLDMQNAIMDDSSVPEDTRASMIATMQGAVEDELDAYVTANGDPPEPELEPRPQQKKASRTA